MSGMFVRIRAKAILLVTTLFVMFALAVVGFAHLKLRSEVEAEVTAATRGAMRVVALNFATALPAARITVHQGSVREATIEAMPAFSDHTVVDQTERMIEGVATVFQKRGADYVRVSTTVKTESGARAVGTTLAADHPAKARLDRGEPYYGPATLFGRAFITGYQPVKNGSGATIGALFVGVPMERADAMVAGLTSSMGMVTACVLSFLSVLAGVLVIRFVRPITGLTEGMKKLAAGEFEIVLPGLARKDEVGDMARAVETFKIKAAEKARHEAEARQAEEARKAEEKRVAEAREAAQKQAADERAAAERKAAMHSLADQFEAAVGHIIDTVSSAATELEAAAGTLTQTANVTQRLSGSVAAASEQASANVQSVASATEEMTASVHEIGRQVMESSTISAEAVKQARRTDARIAELSQAAARIGDVVKLITSVAEQTNLLALNATIEAARAGEAGKGFAVVAQEVKALASQTAKATEEISSQIAGMQTATQDSVAAIKEIGSTIERISAIAASIAESVEQQGAATGEIATNVTQAARGTSEVAANISDVNRGASETGSASSQVLVAAKSLARESHVLKGEVRQFLATIRAA